MISMKKAIKASRNMVERAERDYSNWEMDHTMEEFSRFEAAIKAAHLFVIKHKSKLRKWHWSFSYRMDEITFYEPGRSPSRWDKPNWNPKEIAVYFGKDGWKRTPDHGHCGAINWEKQVEGIKVILKHAEAIKPKLIEAVKI